MRIFFYSCKTTYCGNDCVYWRCPKRCVSRLQSLPVLEEMTDLSEAMVCARPIANIPKSGDLMFLFAASWSELEELISMRDRFEELKVILITDIRTQKRDEGTFHQLQPRYIAAMDSVNMDGLGEVVSRMLANSKVAV
ncbi:hypothetical protein [Desulfopila sp. IMCC35008]|uniref:hypothetical protein n=1 Tax=Desulfopila sp. IMCC35008 TaxID=2653858 RepID=UPI0013D41922|nr:hypothetical protein [Desulfopila sp. IMCC35008]